MGRRVLISESWYKISGGSAGGYTTLCSLTPKSDKVFSGGASYYGVSDLEPSPETHKFEPRYLDWFRSGRLSPVRR